MKRNYYFILLALIFGFSGSNMYAQHIDAGPDQVVCAGETEVNLHADVGRIMTNRYRVESVPFTWFDDFTNAQDVTLNGSAMRIDDQYSDAIDLPFPIQFFGQTYDKIVVGSNGDIIFETSIATTYDSWSIDPSELIPNHTLPYWDSTAGLSFASIMGAYHDIDIGVASPGEELKYVTTGTAPNREFYVIYKEIPQFDCNNLLTSQEIVFYESDASFEVRILNKPVCSTWNDGLATLGIQNEELLPDTCGYYPGDITSPTLPNRNTGVWDIAEPNSEAYKFIPDANVVLTWYDMNRNVVGTGVDVTVPLDQTTTFTLEATFQDCHDNTYTEFDEVTVTKLANITTDLPEEGLICQDETQILDGTVTNASDYTSIAYSWTDGAGNVLGNDPKLTITQPGEYHLTVTVNGICSKEFIDNVIGYPYRCEVPQGISPNGDGLNDNWVLLYLANKPGIHNVQIFDRRGVLVYDKDDYVDEFVGKNNKGNDLPAATYYYVIKLKDGRKLTGWLFLAR